MDEITHLIPVDGKLVGFSWMLFLSYFFILVTEQLLKPFQLNIFMLVEGRHRFPKSSRWCRIIETKKDHQIYGIHTCWTSRGWQWTCPLQAVEQNLAGRPFHMPYYRQQTVF